MRRQRFGGWSAVVLAAGIAAPAGAELRVEPNPVRVVGPEARVQLSVRQTAPGRSVDVTGSAQFRIAPGQGAAVSATGRVEAQRDGAAQLVVRVGREQVRVPVVATGVSRPEPISFARDIVPVLTRHGCNSGKCHGKAEGRNGFRLSVFGFDVEADYRAMVRDAGGRRISRAAPELSLILRKATLNLPHAGGGRFTIGSPAYRLLARWIAEGARFDGEAPAPRLTVFPAEISLPLKGECQLRVVATEADGRTRCVTAEAEFASNATAIADANDEGRIRAGANPGTAAVLVRYRGEVAVCRVILPRPGARFPRPPAQNFLDGLVWDGLERLGIQASGPTDDATFLRRAYLDTIGTLPTAAEARRFLERTRRPAPTSAGTNRPGQPADGQDRAREARRGSEQSAALRTELIGELLERPEYADYWAMRWADILRVDRDAVTPQGAVAFVRWLRRQFAENRPYDQWARELISAQGSTRAEGPAAFYKALTGPDVLSRSISQLFLGTRIECAQCHHHPSERWGQEDYWALAGFFTGVGTKALPDGGEAVVVRPGKDLPHPRSGKLLPARALAAAPPEFAPGADRRAALADWMTQPDNPFFARAIVNRLWAHYFGRGLVEPLDDLRITNPAGNQPLLDALARHLRELRYDLKAFARTLLTSRVYQLSGRPTPTNLRDDQQFSRSYEKALPAEVLLDAISQVTAVPEKFNGWPEGFRAIQVWDNRMPSYFFRIFGRPVRASVCECERSTEPSISQALHLMNSPEITEKIGAPRGLARRLAESDLTPAAILEELFLGTLTRFPSAQERTTLLRTFGEAPNRREGVEDLLWTLLNTREFLYNH